MLGLLFVAWWSGGCCWVLDVGFAAWWSDGLLIKWWSLLDFSGG